MCIAGKALFKGSKATDSITYSAKRQKLIIKLNNSIKLHGHGHIRLIHNIPQPSKSNHKFAMPRVLFTSVVEPCFLFLPACHTSASKPVALRCNKQQAMAGSA